MLRRGESVHHTMPKLFPLVVAEDAPRQIDGRGPEGVVIRRSPEIGRLIARKMLSCRKCLGESAHVALDLRLPPHAPLVTQMLLEDSICFDPRVQFAVVHSFAGT